MKSFVLGPLAAGVSLVAGVIAILTLPIVLGVVRSPMDSTEVSVSYSIEIYVDQYRTNTGRGWDPLPIQPDPFPCLSLTDQGEQICYDTSQPDWRECSNQWHCQLTMQFHEADEIRISVYDKDLTDGGDDLIGVATCRLDQTCRLTNSEIGTNAGTVIIRHARTQDSGK